MIDHPVCDSRKHLGAPLAALGLCAIIGVWFVALVPVTLWTLAAMGWGLAKDRRRRL